MIDTERSAREDHLTKTGIPVRNLWHMLLYVWDVVHLKSHWKAEVDNAPTLDALLSTILANLIQNESALVLGATTGHTQPRLRAFAAVLTSTKA